MKLYAIAPVIMFTLLGWIVYYFVIGNSNASPLVSAILHSGEALVFTLLAFNVVGFAALKLSKWINNRYCMVASHRLMGKALPYVTVGLLLLLLNYAILVIAKLVAGVHPVYTFSDSGWNLLVMVWLLEMVVVSMSLAGSILCENYILQKKAKNLEIENERAKYVALQNQLNPHFLFNSLNTLIAEIGCDPERAVCFAQHLSSVYRYVLQCRDRNLVTLSEELDFMRSYVYMQQIRLGDCIHTQCDVPDECLDCQLPPLTLELLIENIFKHNSVSIRQPMCIHVSVESNSLVVSNRIVPKRKHEPSTGVGLKNLSKRCLAMTRRDIDVSQANSFFTVKVPLLV